MGFNPGGFQESRGHGEAAADQVRSYLQREEDYLLDSILQAFHISLEEPFTTRKAEGDAIPSRFAEAMDRVIEQIDRFKSERADKFSPEEVEIIIAHVNAAFRHYEELLEGCASQLFAELEKMRVDQLSEDTIRGVQRVKDKVVGQINDCIAQIGRLEKRLRQYRTLSQPRWSLWVRIKSLFQRVIDRAVVRKLRKVRKLVNREYDELQVRHTEYRQLDSWASDKSRRIANLRVFQMMPEGLQKQFTEIYRLLKMLKRSQKASDIIGQELNRLLGEVIQVDDAVEIFDGYYRLLREAFFGLRAQVHKDLETTADLKSVKSEATTTIQELRREVHVLGSTVFRYRDFVLKTHPDPYVRARLGFAESTVGPEPETTKRLVRLGHRVEVLNTHFERVSAAVEAYDPARPNRLELGHFDEMLEDLDRMVLEAKRPAEAAEVFHDVIQELVRVEELYYFDRYRVMGVEKVLRLCLRQDRFNLLTRDRHFAELYDTHIQVRGRVPNELQASFLGRLTETNNELVVLIKEANGRILPAQRQVIREKAEQEWFANADKLLTGLEEFLESRRKLDAIRLESLVGEVRERRFEVLHFLYAYRMLLQRFGEIKEPVPASVQRLLDRVHQIEGEFAYLVSQVDRSKGPMTIDELRALENL